MKYFNYKFFVASLIFLTNYASGDALYVNFPKPVPSTFTTSPAGWAGHTFVNCAGAPYNGVFLVSPRNLTVSGSPNYANNFNNAVQWTYNASSPCINGASDGSVKNATSVLQNDVLVYTPAPGAPFSFNLNLSVTSFVLDGVTYNWAPPCTDLPSSPQQFIHCCFAQPGSSC